MTTATRLSPRKQRILDFLRDYIASHTYGPTVREIQAGCGDSSTAVTNYNLHRLREQGYLRWTPGANRSIQLTDSLTLTFTGADAERVRAALGDNPKQRLLEMCGDGA